MQFFARRSPRLSTNQLADSNSKIRFGFCDSDSKTDNFKVQPAPPLVLAEVSCTEIVAKPPLRRSRKYT